MRNLCLMTLALWAGTGCLMMPVDKEQKPAEPPKRAPVTPDQVQDVNADKVAAALEDEVKIDETTSAAPQPAPPTPPPATPAATPPKKSWASW